MNPALISVGAAAAVVAARRADADRDPKVQAYRKALGSTAAAAAKALQDQGAVGRSRAGFTVSVPLDHAGWKESGVTLPLSDASKRNLTTALGERGFTIDSISSSADSVSITGRQKVGMMKGLGWSILDACGR